MGKFFVTFGVRKISFEKTDFSKVEIPDYITLYKRAWFSDFERKIKGLIIKKQVQPIPVIVNLNGKPILIRGYHQFKVLQGLDTNERKLLQPLAKDSLRKEWELEWLTFCLNYAITGPYNLHSKLLSSLLDILKDKRSETIEHKREKIKVIFWLLDSGVPSKLINIEYVWGNIIPDVSVEVPLKGIYQLFCNSFYKEERKSNFSLKFAIEIGKWHKKPDYLKWGIPFVWIPFRQVSDKEIQSFIREVKKFHFYSFLLKYYVHVIDETLSGYLFLPKSEKMA